MKTQTLQPTRPAVAGLAPGIRANAHWIQRGSLVVILLSILLLAWAMPIQLLAEVIQGWAQGLGIWSYAVFIGAYIVFTVVSLPVWPMPFVAGAIFGTLRGSVAASLSCVVAATVTFFIARIIGRTTLRQRLEASPRMRALEKTVETGDWKIVAAVRLSHFLTFGMQNYAFGLTRINFGRFVLATWLVTLPGTVLQVYLGDLGFTSVGLWQEQSAADWQTWGMQLGGLLVLLCAVGYLGHLGRTVYARAVKEQLEQNLEAETEKEKRSFPVLSVILATVAVVLLGISVWSAIERDSLQEFVERHRASSDDSSAAPP